MPKKETIQLRGAQLTGRYDDPLPDVQQPQWRDVPGATVVPRGSSDFEQRGPIILSGFMIVVPSSVQVVDTDGVRVRGEEHELDGAVGDYGKKKIFYTIRVN